MRIDLNVDQYEALTDLICFAYDNGYYHNRLDTDTFDEMADAVHDAKMTVGDLQNESGIQQIY